MKLFIYILLLFGLFFNSFSCHNKSDNGGQPNIQIIGRVLDNSKIQTLIYNLKNKDSLTFYIPKNPWFYYSGDTLYAEAIHKKINKYDKGIIYNQFNPPILEEFKPDSPIVSKVDYKNFTSKTPAFFAIRIYNKKYPYDSKKDYINYHSPNAFLVFDKKNSFLFIQKVYAVLQRSKCSGCSCHNLEHPH